MEEEERGGGGEKGEEEEEERGGGGEKRRKEKGKRRRRKEEEEEDSCLLNVTPRQFVNSYRRHGCSQYLHLQGRTYEYSSIQGCYTPCRVAHYHRLLEDCSALETSVTSYHSTRSNIPEDLNSALCTHVGAV